MNITLKMNIEDQVFILKANLTNAAGRAYRQQYGRDILKDMSKIYKKNHKTAYDAISAIDLSGIDVSKLSEDNISDQIINRVDLEKLLAAHEEDELTFEETERCGQIIWAFVKNADKNTPGYEEWIDNFDFVLPVVDILSILYESWKKSAQPTVELKN